MRAGKNSTKRKDGGRAVTDERQGAASDEEHKPVRTLAVDIGGTGIKTVVLNEAGQPVSERLRVKTPSDATPGAVLDAVADLADKQGDFDRVSVGFPGIVRNGVVLEPSRNLGEAWQDVNIAKLLAVKLGTPVRVANDADVQGFGAISGVGVEMVLTLGTGVGTALFVDGHLVPNVELGKDKLSDAGLHKLGKKKWNKKLAKLVQKLDRALHFDRLYIGGGNSTQVNLAGLPSHVTIISNLNGLVGGIALWRNRRETAPPAARASRPASKSAA
jgi:polyphosphate glucokinase